MALLRPDRVGTLQGTRAAGCHLAYPLQWGVPSSSTPSQQPPGLSCLLLPQLTGSGVAANGKLGQEVPLLRNLGLGEKATVPSGCSRGWQLFSAM